MESKQEEKISYINIEDLTPILQQEGSKEKDQKVRKLTYTCPIDHKGSSLFVKGWINPSNEKSPIIICHDLGESSKDLSFICEEMAALGYNTYSFDMRGHGATDQHTPSHNSMNQLALDLLQVVAWVKHKEKGLKPILIGQGLGANISISLSKGYSKFFEGLVLVSPLLSLSKPIQPYKRFFIRYLSELFPSVKLPKFIQPKFTFALGKVQKSIPKISFGFCHEIMISISQSRKNFQRFNQPVLFIHAEFDPISKYDFIRKIVTKKKAKKFRFLVLQNCRVHRILSASEEISRMVAIEIDQWIKSF